jgi:hypothetical protein
LRFCLLAMPRTGSSRLAALLDSHAHIVCHHELFHATRPWWSRQCPVPTTLDRDLERRRDDPLGWLEEAFAATAAAAPEARAIGFKLQITDRPRVLEHVLLESDMQLVLLYRANRVAQYASDLSARRTGRYASSDPPFAAAAPLPFELEDFLAFVERQALASRLVRDLVDDDARLFVIEYSEVGTAAANAALLAFLGQEEAPLAAPDERMGSAVIRERFADPDAVAASLAQTVWRPWLDRDAS